MKFEIKTENVAVYAPLLSDCVPRLDGQRFATVFTKQGIVFGISRGKDDDLGPAETRLYLVRDSVMFNTKIAGKAYTPSGMKKLAVQFANQCSE